MAWAITCPAAAPGQLPPDPLAEARTFATAGKLAESEAILHPYVLGHPESADAHFLLGYVLFREQKATESLAEFTAGAKFQHPRSDELKVVASDYVLLADYSDADKWYSEVVKETPNDADAWYLLGRAKYSESIYPGAIKCFEQALALRPKDVESENNLGLSWRALNDTEKAQAAFQTAIDWQGSAPADAQPFLNLGTVFVDAKDFDKALPYLLKAAEISQENPAIHEQLAKVYEGQSSLPKAQAELEKAIELAPKASGLHYKLGRIYRSEGMREKSQHEFELSEQLSSTHSSTATPNPFKPEVSAPQ
jgi:tetratricopeptide (TPR) repeat protein